MKAGWGERIKARARELGMSDAAVARALDLPQRRYSAYVNETREPDFATLGRICRALATTPDAVLGFAPHPALAAEDAVSARLEATLRALGEADRTRALAVVETLAAHPTATGPANSAQGVQKSDPGTAASKPRGTQPS